jgi:4-nitrophenyl phosphatase
MTPPILTTPEEYQKLLDSVDTFLLDCDGVIYHGSHVVPGVPETLKMLRATGRCPLHARTPSHGLLSTPAGKKIIFVTNNASKSRRQYKGTFDKLGIEAKTVSCHF